MVSAVIVVGKEGKTYMRDTVRFTPPKSGGLENYEGRQNSNPNFVQTLETQLEISCCPAHCKT